MPLGERRPTGSRARSAAFTPDVFRCGNPATDEEFLWSRSPLPKVDEIRIPMLIAQGANDPRVKQAESEQAAAEKFLAAHPGGRFEP